MAGKKYTHVRNVIISRNSGPLASGHSEPFASCHSEGAERPKNLIQGKLREKEGDGPSRSW